MKRKILNVQDIKNNILSLKGSVVAMDINRGRKKIESLSGMIKDVYPSVFTVVIEEVGQIQTFSYYDVLCGNVVLKTN